MIDQSHIDAAASDLARRWARNFKAPPMMTVDEWGDRYREMSKIANARGGKWRSRCYQKEMQQACTDKSVRSVVIVGAAQCAGKALSINTPIPTPAGWRTMGDLRSGDFVYGLDGKKTEVIFATETMHDRKCYRVTFDTGDEIVCDADHLWSVERVHRGWSENRILDRTNEILTTEKIAEFQSGNKLPLFRIPLCQPVDGVKSALPIPAYTLGAWLGDGHSYSASIIGSDQDIGIIDRIRSQGYHIRFYRDGRNETTFAAFLERDPSICCRGHDLKKTGNKKGQCRRCAVLATEAYRDKIKIEPRIDSFYMILQREGLLKNKHIPRVYLDADIATRWELLQGLMDTDGTASGGSCELCLTDPRLARDAYELCLSLGIKAAMKKSNATIYGRVVGFRYRITFAGNPHLPIFGLERKQRAMKTPQVSGTSYCRQIVKIERTESVPVKCIQVAAEDSLYLCGNFIPTHNTEVILNFIGRQAHLNPGPILLVNPAVEFTERFSKRRLNPMIADTRILRDLFGDPKSRSSNNTLRSKDFPGGSLFLGSANVASDLASDPQRDVLIDELDRCDAACGNEGDIVSLAEARQGSFGEQAFSLYTSTPSGTKPRPQGQDQPARVSKIMLLFSETDQRYWFCPCQKCGAFQTLKWSQVQWAKDQPETARYICDTLECAHPHTDAERIKMIEGGEWRATAPFAGRRGYFLNGIASLAKPERGCSTRMGQMARDFLRAKRRGKEALKTWVNTFLCECFDDEGAESVDPHPLFTRRESYGATINESIVRITAGVDVHPDRIEAQSIGWGLGEEGWILDYQVFIGDTKKAGAWEALDKWLLTGYEHPFGVVLPIEYACVDTGNSTDEAYDFCRVRTMRGVMPVKGIKGYGIPVMSRPKKSGVRRVQLWIVAKNTALRTLHSRLMMVDSGPGYIHFPRDRGPLFEEEYFKQLTSNDVHLVKRAGVEIHEFDPKGRRDEAADTWVYALAALRRTDTNFEKILQRMKEDYALKISGENRAKEPEWFAGERPPQTGWL